MKKVFYNIVCSTCDTYDQSLYNLKSNVKTKPEKVVEYVINDFNSTAEQYLNEDEIKNYKCNLTVEDLAKLEVGQSLDIDFVPETEDCGKMFTWTIYKMAVEITFPLDGNDKLEDGIDVKFIDDIEVKEES